MMRTASVVALVLFASSSAFGAVATFTPAYQEVNLGDYASMSVGVALEGGGVYDFANLQIGSNDLLMDWGTPLEGTVFTYDANWVALNAFPPTVGYNPTGWPQNVFVGGFLSTATDAAETVGTLVVGTNGLTIGEEYTVFVDSRDGVSMLGQEMDFDPLVSMGTVKVVPEPAALALLGLGGLAALRRRRA
jgi:hypothetical protein